MPGIKEYIRTRGHLSFDEDPFCEADGLTLSQISYLPFENAVSPYFDAQPVSFGDAARTLYRQRGEKNPKLGIMIPSDACVNSMLMIGTKRFSSMKVYAVQEVFSADAEVQYCAGTFLFPDGTAVVVFRGTDDTLIGWKEDIDMFTKKGTPSYALAVEYLRELSEHVDGDILLCGHSKGGHVALWAALHTSDKIRQRIKGIYNNDGPGYYSGVFFDMPEYKELLPVYHHLVPHSSFVGMMMCHDYDYKAVVSSKPLGPFQHDLSSWQIVDGEVVLRDDVDSLAHITDKALAGIMAGVSDEQRDAIDSLATKIIKGTKEVTLTDVITHPLTAAGGAVKAFRSVAPETKKIAASALKGAGSVVAEAVKSVTEKAEEALSLAGAKA